MLVAMMKGRASRDGIVGRERRRRSCRRRRFSFLSDAARQVALWIDVHEEHALVAERERRREIDGRRGLADPALLIGDRNDASHIYVI